MTSILVKNDNDNNNNNVNIINTIKQKALKPTSWTLKHLNIDNENNNNNISRLETIFLRFLYQYEHILLHSINENSNNNIELRNNIYCYDSNYDIFNTSCKNACTYFNNNNNNNNKNNVTTSNNNINQIQYKIIDNLKDANIIFGFIPNLEIFISNNDESNNNNNMNNNMKNNIHKLFVNYKEEDNKKMYFLLYGDSECFTQTDNQLIQDQRSLFALQLEMILNPILKEKGFQSLKPINVEFDDGGDNNNYNNNDKKKKRYSGMGKKQITMLNGGNGDTIMFKSESWHVLTNDDNNVMLNLYDNFFINTNSMFETGTDEHNNNNNNVPTTTEEDNVASNNYYTNNLLEKLPDELRAFHNQLITWKDKQLIKWNTDVTFQTKNLKKFQTRDHFQSYLNTKVQQKFFKTLKKKGYIDEEDDL